MKYEQTILWQFRKTEKETPNRKQSTGKESIKFFKLMKKNCHWLIIDLFHLKHLL